MAVNPLVGRRNVAVWDERRNSSRVFPVPPDALPTALRALKRWRETAPEHAAWIIEGAPLLSEQAHFDRFGSRYLRENGRKRFTQYLQTV